MNEHEIDELRDRAATAATMTDTKFGTKKTDIHESRARGIANSNLTQRQKRARRHPVYQAAVADQFASRWYALDIAGEVHAVRDDAHLQEILTGARVNVEFVAFYDATAARSFGEIPA